MDDANVEPDLVVSSDTKTSIAVNAGRLELMEAVASGAVRAQGDKGTRTRGVKVLGTRVATIESR